jgi:hypothetical protein
MKVRAINSKFLIKSLDKKFLSDILALIFLLTIALPEITSSQESQVGEQNILRQASQHWMQVGIKQYRRNLFTDAERSFRRAYVFQKYLTAAERQQLKEYLANVRIAISEGKQAIPSTQAADESVEPNQPVKAEMIVEKVKESGPSTEKERKQIKEEPALITEGREQTEERAKAQAQLQAQAQAYAALEEQLKAEKQARLKAQQEAQPVKAVEPEEPEIQAEEESSQDDVIVIKDKSFKAEFLRLSAWLSQNRRNVLIIGLSALVVLVLIAKVRARRKRPGKRIYKNSVPANSSFIGTRLNGNSVNNQAVEGSKDGSSASAAAANPKRKSFDQSTEYWMDHWKKRHAIKVSNAGKPARVGKKWPQRKDKHGSGHNAVAKAGQKQCRKCKEMKAHTDFHKDKSCEDGLARWCMKCKREYRKKRTASKK